MKRRKKKRRKRSKQATKVKGFRNNSRFIKKRILKMIQKKSLKGMF
jgi:hypothetical protein